MIDGLKQPGWGAMQVHLAGVVALLAGLLFAVPAPISAEMISTGKTCWTGKFNGKETPGQNVGWTWSLTGTYVTDNNEIDNAYLRCIGFGGSVAGKEEPTDYWCTRYYPDGSTTLSRGTNAPDGTSSAKFISGTGAYEGIRGEIRGGIITRRATT